jgi:glycosyltransferase involved in cell wall biosynthesis
VIYNGAKMKKKCISIIVSCFNEKENIEEMYKRVARVFKNLKAYDYELIYVDNASEDGSEKIYEKLAKADIRVKMILMSRNFGSPQSSFVAGMEYCRGDAAILLHGDIQDPPELIGAFIKRWEEGYEVVYGIRKSRKGYNVFWNILYKGFYYVLNRFAYIRIPLNAGEFSLIDRKVITELLAIDEYDYYLRCLRAYVGFAQIGIPYVRDPRMHGRSSENLKSSLWWAKTILINFSFKPLEWISTIALIVTIFAFGLVVFDVVAFTVADTALRGVPTIVILILFLGGVQLLSLSVIAEYLAKIFLEVKHRPKYIVWKTFNLKKKG